MNGHYSVMEWGKIVDSMAGLLALMRASEDSIYHNAQVKHYPDGSAVVMCFDRCIIRERGFEAVGGPRGPQDDAEGGDRGKGTTEAENLARSKRRARSAVYDLARATDFEYFVTLTVDQAKLDRYDSGEVFKHLHDWLDNCVRRKGLAYVLVPERHKDGAIHFHALFNDALAVVDSGTISMPGGGKPKRPRSKAQRAAWLAAGGHVVYNLPAWGWGFTTAIRLYGEREAAVGYVVKYITKSVGKIGGRWYYSGGDLRRPSVAAVDLDFSVAAELGHVFDVEELGCHGVKITIRSEDYGKTLEMLRRPS